MSALPMNFDSVLLTFQHPVPVPCIDTIGMHGDGGWEEQEAGRRKILAIVLAMPADKLELYKEGDSSAAGLILHTKETLYFTDVKNHGVELRQSHIEYHGYRFRVFGTGFMFGNANFNTYEAVRFFR